MIITKNKKSVVFSIITTCFLGLLTFQCNQRQAIVGVPDQVDFNFHVKPILVQNCYLCHGPDPSSRKGDLRLDTFEGATALRDNGKFAIVPGSVGRSELVHRVTNEDPSLRMPPPETNLKLTEYEVEVLRKWIDRVLNGNHIGHLLNQLYLNQKRSIQIFLLMILMTMSYLRSWRAG